MGTAAIPKGKKTGGNKAMVHFKIEVMFHSDLCSSFLVSYERVYILKAMLPQRGNVLQHTEIHPSGSRQKDNQSLQYWGNQKKLN